MTLTEERTIISKEMETAKQIFLKTIQILPSFNITDPKILPYGLKPHTRSVSWIIEQVITQQTKFHCKEFNIEDVDINIPDTALHDCIVKINLKDRLFINIKVHNSDGNDNKNDIAAVEKLFMQYKANPNYRLIYAVFAFRFSNVTISFLKDHIHIFSPQFLPIYINPRNDKLQAYYEHSPVYRTRDEFLDIIRTNSKSIILD